jgi:hypothetical protein
MIDLGDHIYISPADAAVELNRQIVAKHGSDPDVVDRLEIISRQVPTGNTGRMAQVTLAIPAGEKATDGNICFTMSGVFNRRND